MGTQKDVEFAYDDINGLWRLSLGEHADISAAYYKTESTVNLSNRRSVTSMNGF